MDCSPTSPWYTCSSCRGSQNRQLGGNSPSTGGGKKSGVGGGAIAGIVISILVVGTVIAFFLLKRRSRKSSTDIEKTRDQSFAHVALQPQAVQGIKHVQASSMDNTKTLESPESINLKPPPMDHQKSFDDDDFSAIPVIPKKTSVAPLDAISYSITDLQIATDSFSADNLIGEGSIGRVFRAQFEDGKPQPARFCQPVPNHKKKVAAQEETKEPPSLPTHSHRHQVRVLKKWINQTQKDLHKCLLLQLS